MRKVKRAAKSADPRKISQFLGAAFDDYLGSRLLIRSGLLTQGAVLASTAIEKYCKTVLAFRGNESTGHLKPAHWQCLRNFDPEIYGQFNEQFFQMLRKAYGLRYPDSLPANFNIVIRSRKLLAELDFTALSLHSRFAVRHDDGVKRSSSYEIMLERRDKRLLEENHVLLGQSKAAFIESDNQLVYECRRSPSRGLVEFHYMIAPMPSDGMLMREGLQESADGMTYTFTAEPSEVRNVPATCQKCGASWTERARIAGRQVKFLDWGMIPSPQAEDAGRTDTIRFVFAVCPRCAPEQWVRYKTK